MPMPITKGAASSQGFGEFSASAAAFPYIENVFSTYLYTGNGTSQTISNGIGLAATAAWSSYKLQQGFSIGYGVTVDSSGNFYVTGGASDGVNDYIIIAKYNSSGTIQWQRKLYQNSSSGGGIAVDTSGNVYITGNANDGTNYYIIVAKYNSSGTIQWQRKLKQNNSYGKAIAVDSSGNVYVAGQANDGAGNYGLLAKYNTSGTIQWQRKIKQNPGGSGNGVAVDGSGNVYYGGIINNGTNNFILIAKYDSSGTIQWQRSLREGDSQCYAITADSSGNVYVTGNANDGSNYIIIAKYNTSGTIQWQRKLRQNSSTGYGISVDTSGNVYVTGNANDGTTNYIVVAKYNSSGTIQWQRKLQQNGSICYGISVDSSGNVYATGYAINGTDYYVITSILKQDGSTTSGTAFVTMVDGTATDSAGTATDSAGVATDSAGGATDSAGGATDSAGTATATSATQAAVTGTPGGLVWIKSRSAATNNNLFDTAQGATKSLHSNTTDATTTDANSLTAFIASGFTLGTGSTAGNEVNVSAATYASWTFAKQAKFFDIVTYTGNGANRTISHNLGSVPGCIIVKRTDTTAAWAVYHGSLANTEYLVLNTNAAKATGTTYWNSTTPTSTVFSLGTSTDVNANGGTYVAYLFANNAGGFGNAGTDNVITCGSFTTNGSGNATVSLGYEPQLVIAKRTDGANAWCIQDNMRGFTANPTTYTLNPILLANTVNADVTTGANTLQLTQTGFKTDNISYPPSNTFIYIAIRRGPMKTPTSGTSVFGLNARTGTGAIATVTGSAGVSDAALIKNRGAAVADLFSSRLTGTGYLVTSSTAAEVAAGSTILQANPWDVMDGVKVGTTSTITNASGNTYINYLFGRAPGFFDVVCYTGTGSATTISHNLGVAPELIIAKSRSLTDSWFVYSSPVGNQRTLYLDGSNAQSLTGSSYWNNTTPTTSVFTVGAPGAAGSANQSGYTYVAYLFATVTGVSKVGSYTGTGALQTVNCGFTSGARFVLIKRTDSTGDWYVYDSARGITSGNDPYFLLNSSAAQVTTTNYVDTDSTGFQVTAAAPAGLNANGGSFIFLAIA